MTTLNFDLNIKNYTLIELRKLLNLEVPFTENEIMEKTDSIKTKIIRDDTLSTVKKEDIIKFILKAESILKLDLEQYFYNDLSNNKFINNRQFLSIPEIDSMPNEDKKYKNWPKGASVLYYNKVLQIFQIYVKNSFAGTTPNWSIFNSI
tara:strand:+ start:570 stop:1016 length:447 start_codon:yes stop_codon:yes gene_type:complete